MSYILSYWIFNENPVMYKIMINDPVPIFLILDNPIEERDSASINNSNGARDEVCGQRKGT